MEQSKKTSTLSSMCEKIKGFMKKVWAILVKIYKWITGFGVNKYIHFIAGIVITATVAFVPNLAPFSFTVAVIAGVAKECIDYLRKKGFDETELFATILGSALAQICIWIYLIIF